MFLLYNLRSRLNLVHLNSSKTTSLTFLVISTISVKCMKNSSLINDVMPHFEEGGAYCIAHVCRYIGMSVGRHVGRSVYRYPLTLCK